MNIADDNDNPPTLGRKDWKITIDETEGDFVDNSTILTMAVNDRDINNDFHYKVSHNSLRLLG